MGWKSKAEVWGAEKLVVWVYSSSHWWNSWKKSVSVDSVGLFTKGSAW